MSHRKHDLPGTPIADAELENLPDLPKAVLLRGSRQARWVELMTRIEAYQSSSDFKPLAPGESVTRIRALRDEWD